MIDPYCDSDEEVFFGPMTLREVKVIFNLRGASPNKQRETERCISAGRTFNTLVAVLMKHDWSEFLRWRNETVESKSPEKTQDPPQVQLQRASEREEGSSEAPCTEQSVAGESRLRNDDTMSLCSNGVLNERIPTSCPAELGKYDSSNRMLGEKSPSTSFSLSGAAGELTNVTRASVQKSLDEDNDGAESSWQVSLADSGCDNDLDDTLERMNKLLAQGDESPLASMLSDTETKPTNKISLVLSVLESSTEDFDDAGHVGNVPAHISVENEHSGSDAEKHQSSDVSSEAGGQGVLEHDRHKHSLHSEKSDSSGVECGQLTSCGEEVSSMTEDRHEGNDSLSEDKENAGDGRGQVPRSSPDKAVFTQPSKHGFSAHRSAVAKRPQLSAAKARYAVQSPVGMYIRSSPAPSLVQNVRPTPRRNLKAISTLDHKKPPVGAAAAASPSLPVVRYASKQACMLVSEPHSVQKLPPSFKKLISTPEPVVTRHQGRFQVRNLRELQGNVSDSDAEVSILVQMTAHKTGVRLE